MEREKVWTAAELEQMTPNERYRLFNERVVTDLTALPPELVARIRARGSALLAERNSSGTAAEDGGTGRQ